MRTMLQLLAATLLLGMALAPAAVAQDLPDAIDDPAAAIAPAEPAPSPPPAEPAAGPGNAGGAGDGAIDGIADATVDEPDVTAHQAPDPAPVDDATAVTTGPGLTGSGQLPFTGPDPRQLVLLLLVGSLGICAGIVATAWASAHGRPDRSIERPSNRPDFSKPARASGHPA